MREYNTKTSLGDVIDETLDKVKTLMQTNSVVGEPINIGSVCIIPITKVSVGFVAGGGEYSDKSSRRVANHYPMAGGTGGGVSVNPVGFLINNDGDVKYVDVEDKSAYQATLNLINKISTMIPSLIKKQSDKKDTDKQNENK